MKDIAYRKSNMLLGEVYFWTSSIYKHIHLLRRDTYKNLIIDCLSYLVQKEKIAVYAFVIMPNHLHFIWEILAKNGKEKPIASFHKFTAHEIQSDLRESNPVLLEKFKVNESERKYRIWQRDPLALLVYDKRIFEQKLDYMHNNPLQEHWNLSKHPEEYYYSSAAYYNTESRIFDFITDYRNRF